MNFEMFTDEDVNKIIEHSLEVMEQKDKDIIIDKYGTLEDYKQLLAQGLKDEKQTAQFIKIYGSKDKAMFKVDNAGYLLLEVEKEYLNHSQLGEATDKQYGKGVTKYIGHAIQQYYGA